MSSLSHFILGILQVLVNCVCQIKLKSETWWLINRLLLLIMEDFELVKFENFSALLDGLKHQLPDAASVYNNLFLHTHKYVDLYDFYNLPGAGNTVLWKDKKVNQISVGLYCSEEEVEKVKKALRCTQLLDWGKTLCIFHVPDYLLTAMQEVAKALTGLPLDTSPVDVFIYNENENFPSCAHGFEVCCLGEEGMRQMYENWRYKLATTFQEFKKACAFAAVGVYKNPEIKEHTVDIKKIVTAADNKKPVSWIAANPYGPLDFMNTVEKYTKQGFDSLLIDVCARMMMVKGLFPHVCIEKPDVNLRNIYEKLPSWSNSYKVIWVCQCIDKTGKRMSLDYCLFR